MKEKVNFGKISVGKYNLISRQIIARLTNDILFVMWPNLYFIAPLLKYYIWLNDQPQGH